MTVAESTIYINLVKLRKMLYMYQFLMDKTNRIVYGTPMMQSVRDSLANYVMAFEVDSLEEKQNYMSKCIGEFANVRMDLDFIKDENMFHFKKPKTKGKANENSEEKDESQVKHEKTLEEIRYEENRWIGLYEIIARIDDEIRRYNKSIRKRYLRDKQVEEESLIIRLMDKVINLVNERFNK